MGGRLHLEREQLDVRVMHYVMHCVMHYVMGGAFILSESSSTSVSYVVYSCSRVARVAFSCASA